MMLGFRQFIVESPTVAAPEDGISHSDHAADLSFRGKSQARHALRLLRGVATGSVPVTEKMDDKISFHAIKTPEGKIAIKYKGKGSHYDYSVADIEKQHGHKPYKAESLKAAFKNLHKILPDEPGEYQGGVMSTPDIARATEGGRVGHTPNLIKYSYPENSPEGRKLAKSKVSLTIHTKLTGEKRNPEQILDQSNFKSHPDVHLVHHTVSKEEQKLAPSDKKIVLGHLSSAQKLMKDHSYDHLTQHNHPQMLESYINSTVLTDEKPTVKGYRAHVEAYHNKKINAVKTEKAKASKAADRDAALNHIDQNREAFQRSLDIHHHLQSAANHLADSLDKNTQPRKKQAGLETTINGNESGGEGYMAPGGIKVVNRPRVSKNLLGRSAALKAGKETK